MNKKDERLNDGIAAEPNQTILDIPTAAARLGVTKQTVYGWARTRAGFPKIFKVGAKKSGILAQELDAWIIKAWRQGGAA